MLAGCSLSSRHQMSTAQRLPCGFSKRGGRGDATGAGAAPRVVPGGDGRGGNGTCSFRAHPAPPVTQAVSWGAKPEPSVGDGGWEVRSRAVKRAHEEEAAAEEYGAPVVRAKRTRMGGDGDEVWFHQSIAGTAAMMQVAAGEGGEEEVAEEERKVFLVPSAAAFPHGMVAAAGRPAGRGQAGGVQQVAVPLVVLVGHGRRSGRRWSSWARSPLAPRPSPAASTTLPTTTWRGLARRPRRPGPRRSTAWPPTSPRRCARAANMWPHVFDVTPPRELTDGAFHDDDDALALRVLNSVTPIPRFLHFTLNERLIRAFDGHDRVHIIDFDIKQGLQWPSLLQSLAARRPEPPAHVRITGVGSSRQELQDTGARLAHVAAGLGLAFEFHAVVDRLEDVRLWMLHVKRGERVAVNCILAAHRLLRDETGGALSDFLGLVRSTGASVLLLGEHEAAGLNGGRWEARFARALQHYAAAFDAVGAAGLPPASAARAKAEEMFAREIRNAVAFEGPDRSERHESFAGWRRRMEDGGFRNAGIGDREAMQGRMIARMFAPGKYGVHPQGDGEAHARWLDSPLYTVTAWTPAGDGAAVSASTTASHSLQS
ncbi:hypothetical protein ZWY2020_042153 [Hordeum vulgare]|nr:hypothetical protein ZWY2020_042153 [Hordeum vulgare]